MDNESQRELARMLVIEQLFDTEGWKELHRELSNELEVIRNTLLYAVSWEETRFQQGRADQIQNILALEDSIGNVKKAMLLEDEFVEEG